jgi:ABC-2 type transport system permease protein
MNMHSDFALLKREFWENQGAFVTLPLILIALLFLGSLYIVIRHASPDSELGLGIFYMGNDIAGDAGERASDADAAGEEYIVDFTRGELVRAEQSDVDTLYTLSSGERDRILNAYLYLIHIIFCAIIGFVVLFYLLNGLHADRKDRSVLFWKSMPVSETRNVLIKLFTAAVAVPVLVTAFAWLAQIIYVVMSMIFVYRVGADPWVVIWSRLEIMQAFFEQLLYVLWLSLWMLPVAAWLLFASALARRSPFLVAILPFAVVFLLEYLLFGTSYAADMISDHFSAIDLQMNNYMDERISYGPVDLTFDASKIITGIVIAGALLAGAVWLRNNRFEL